MGELSTDLCISFADFSDLSTDLYTFEKGEPD